MEQHHGRNAANTVGRGHLRVGLGIELGHAYTPLQLQRGARKQALMALPTIGRAPQVGALHAVGGVALGVGDVQGFRHGRHAESEQQNPVVHT